MYMYCLHFPIAAVIISSTLFTVEELAILFGVFIHVLCVFSQDEVTELIVPMSSISI